MDLCFDLLEWLGPDTSTSVLMLLDDPADLVRASAVSRSWRRFVVYNGFCKKLCLRMCLEVSCFVNVVESTSRESAEVGSSSAMEWESLEKEHRAYSYLSYCLVSIAGNGDCIGASIRASSTDNYPDESIEHTLVESDRVDLRPSYWSSEGESDPGVPETLTYRLGFKLCIINEIRIQPFQAYFQDGNPIYSAKAVRFRMGHSRSPQVTGMDANTNVGQGTPNENYTWTYVSPSFPMVQENSLQSFKLPRPVICIGGIVQIELLGRVQVQEMDGLYYICVCHVQVIGRPLTPIFDANFLEDDRQSVLKFFPEKHDCCLLGTSDSCASHTFRERIKHMRARRGWNQRILNTLLGVVESDSDDDADS
ncbi:F-box protein-like [Iris pallida]|uniref:F-box protein-like n=1 Tax=Iris pallida TaxID=29817 RepID=A0AAX6HHX8_IRIPA|nr:F-box protein-like [Iris pallida]KAJ6842065.1 F-box protein-like [Iris pallida]